MKRHKKEHHEEHMDETWLVPYSDLLTLLLALFIILFAMSKVDQKKFEQVMSGFIGEFTGSPSVMPSTKGMQVELSIQNSANNPGLTPEQLKQQETAKREMQEMDDIKSKIDGYIKENNLSTQLETVLEQERLIIRIRDFALFDSGSAVIKADSQKLASVIAEMMNKYPSYPIEIAGYTDNIPINTPEFETNWDLSSKRALNFMKYLLRTNSNNPGRFRAIGYSEYHPIAPNTTEEGRAKNRRVEVNIIRTGAMAPKAPKAIP